VTESHFNRCSTRCIAKQTPGVRKKGDQGGGEYVHRESCLDPTHTPSAQPMATRPRPSGVAVTHDINTETRVGIDGRLPKVAEQVTFPVKFSSLFHDRPVLAINVGAKNVSVLSVPASNTLFDSCITFLSPIASSNLTFHSNRAWAVSTYRVDRPPDRPLW